MKGITRVAGVALVFTLALSSCGEEPERTVAVPALPPPVPVPITWTYPVLWDPPGNYPVSWFMCWDELRDGVWVTMIGAPHQLPEWPHYRNARGARECGIYPGTPAP